MADPFVNYFNNEQTQRRSRDETHSKSLKDRIASLTAAAQSQPSARGQAVNTQNLSNTLSDYEAFLQSESTAGQNRLGVMGAAYQSSYDALQEAYKKAAEVAAQETKLSARARASSGRSGGGGGGGSRGGRELSMGKIQALGRLLSRGVDIRQYGYDPNDPFIMEAAQYEFQNEQGQRFENSWAEYVNRRDRFDQSLGTTEARTYKTYKQALADAGVSGGWARYMKSLEGRYGKAAADEVRKRALTYYGPRQKFTKE